MLILFYFVVLTEYTVIHLTESSVYVMFYIVYNKNMADLQIFFKLGCRHVMNH
jgi:hypothetical protein